MTPHELVLKALFGILIPALVAGITWGIAWRIWNRSAAPIAGGTWAGGVAVGLAMLAGYLGTEDWPGFPPHTAIGWLVAMSIAGLLGTVYTIFKSGTSRILVGAIFFAMLATTANSAGGTGWMKWGLFGTLWIGSMFIVGSQDVLAKRWPGASIPLSLWVWSVGIAASLALTGSIMYGHLAGILAAILGAGLVVAWIKPAISFAGGAMTTSLYLGFTFIVCGYFYSELPASSAIILGIAPLILLVGNAHFVTRRKPWVSASMRAALIAFPVVLALFFAAWPMFFPPPSKGGPASSAEENYYK